MPKNRIRHLLRYRTIASAIARNSFGYVTDGIEGLRHKPHRGDWEADWPKERKLGYRIRLMLEELGPTFVKLGQIASTRPDQVPAGMIEELQKLQDHVKPFPYVEVRKLVEKELHAPIGDVFRSFSREPLAAASIGQVHRAVLNTGEQVIVKVQRPGVQASMETDLAILSEWARISEGKLDWARHYRLRDAIGELGKALLNELNYVEEARNAEKMAASNKLPYIHIPAIHWHYTTRRILTMELVKGIQLSDREGIRQAGYDSKLIAKRLTTAVFSQILEAGFFHADPHPGNVMALPDNRLAFLDFGMVGKLPHAMKKQFASFVVALRNQSTKGVLRAIGNMGVIPEECEPDKLYEDVEELRLKYYRVPLNQVSIGVAVQDLFRVAYRHRIRIPGEMTMLGKSMLTMEGVAASLDPDISVMDVAEPFGKKLFLEQINPLELGKRVWEELPEYVDLLQKAPSGLKELAGMLRKGKLRVEADSPQLGELLGKLDRLINRLSFSIVLLALSIVMLGLIVGAAISGTTSPIIGKVPVIEAGFLIALLMFFWLIYAIFRSGRF